MRNRQGGDASFVMGLVLGLFVGVAAVLILTPQPEDSFPKLSAEASEAKDALEEKAGQAEDRVEGAAEGAT